MIKVRFIHREKREAGFSIEGIFEAVKSTLQGRIDITDYYQDISRSKLGNLFTVRKSSHKIINHVTGDVQYLMIGLKGNKNILTIHDINHYYSLKKQNAIHALIYKWCWLYLPFKNADIITVVSDFTKQQIVELFPFAEKKIVIVHNPIKPILQYTPRQNRHDRFRVLQIGKGPHKNLKKLIEAIKNDPQEYQLDIVADIDQDTRAELDALGIQYSLYVNISDEELYERYKDCDVLYFASTYEGFGMPITEAQAVGRPVITTNYGAMKEVAGDSAILVDPYNANEILDALTSLKKDESLYRQKVEEGLKNAKEYNSEVIAEKYYKLYKQLATYA